MTRSFPTKLSAETYFQFLPFHEIFMSHIENMGWITSLFFIKPGTDYNIAEYFGLVIKETIEIDYQTLEISTQRTDNIKKLKFRSLYTWIFNSSDKSTQDLLAK